MNRAYRVALFCGALPLLVGVAIFLLWIVTRWPLLLGPLGILALLGGVAMFPVVAIALARSCWQDFSNPDVPRRRLWLSTLGAGGLLLSNVLVVGVLFVGVIAVHTVYSVVISNASRHRLDEVHVSGGGCEIEFGSISPGNSVRRTFWIQHDGTLILRAARGGAVSAKTISGYVTHNQGGHTLVTVNPDGSFTVEGD
ncbi:hypothetical protein EP7_000444 [Isosphaeraceae bacterium EP7]